MEKVAEKDDRKKKRVAETKDQPTVGKAKSEKLIKI